MSVVRAFSLSKQKSHFKSNLGKSIEFMFVKRTTLNDVAALEYPHS